MKLPAQIYAIYPLNKDGKIAGVYVGRTNDVLHRLYQHTTPRNGKDNQEEFHSLMRENGFYYQVLDDVKVFAEGHLEKDWIKFFEMQDVKLFNKAQTTGYKTQKGEAKGGNAENLIRKQKDSLVRFSVPHWTGAGVVWRVETRQEEAI